MRAFALASAAVLVAGCTNLLAGPPLDQCTAGLLPEGHEVRVQVVWNATAEPVAGACVRAHPTGDPPADTGVRTDAGGMAVLRLPERTWRINAILGKPPDGLCAWVTDPDEPGDLAVTGAAEVRLTMFTEGGVCV
jgi:hypothetical protein